MPHVLRTVSRHPARETRQHTEHGAGADHRRHAHVQRRSMRRRRSATSRRPVAPRRGVAERLTDERNHQDLGRYAVERPHALEPEPGVAEGRRVRLPLAPRPHCCGRKRCRSSQVLRWKAASRSRAMRCTVACGKSSCRPHGRHATRASRVASRRRSVGARPAAHAHFSSNGCSGYSGARHSASNAADVGLELRAQMLDLALQPLHLLAARAVVRDANGRQRVGKLHGTVGVQLDPDNVVVRHLTACTRTACGRQCRRFGITRPERC